MSYHEAYKLATWVCLNCASDEYTIHRFWQMDIIGRRYSLVSIRNVLKCVDKHRDMIDIAKLHKLFPN